MMTVTEYLSENSAYIGFDNLGVIEGLTECQFAALCAATVELCGDPEPGLACALVRTAEQIEDFDSARDRHWSERGKREDISFAGHAAVKYTRAQNRRGETRQDLIVVDFGDFRIVLK